MVLLHMLLGLYKALTGLYGLADVKPQALCLYSSSEPCCTFRLWGEMATSPSAGWVLGIGWSSACSHHGIWPLLKCIADCCVWSFIMIAF